MSRAAGSEEHQAPAMSLAWTWDSGLPAPWTHPQSNTTQSSASPLPLTHAVITVSSSNRKSFNQKIFTSTFPKPPQPSNKKKSRLLELHNTVPRQDKRKLKEGQKKAHIWIKHSFRKYFQRPCIYLAVSRQAPFGCSYIPKDYPEKAESKESNNGNKITDLMEDCKKKTGASATTLKFKKTVNNENYKRRNKVLKIPSKSSHENEPYKQSKFKLDTNSEYKDSKEVSMENKRKDKKDSKYFKDTNTEFICTKTGPKKDSKSSKKVFGAKSDTHSKNNSNVDSMMYLEESSTESMDFYMWLRNYSQNNSKKGAKKDTKKGAKKVSDGESVDSKKGKKNAKKDSKKKNSKQDLESTDTESVDSKDAKKNIKRDKKDTKKKHAKKDVESTNIESESEIESKKTKKDKKKDKKNLKKGNKKKDAKNSVSTDSESESELETKKVKRDERKDKRDSKKDDKKKDSRKYALSTDESKSEWKFKKNKKDFKKDAKKDTESTDDESDEYPKKGLRKHIKSAFEDSASESDESLHKPGSENRVDESDATSTDSNKEAQELKKRFRMSYKKTTFQGKGKKAAISRVSPSRERPPLPLCEPLTPSPKVKRLCRCKMPPPRPKPRYAPLVCLLLFYFLAQIM
ncbi:PREDICTED: cylicin-1 [Chrysochloris asiatica]|uniref:Cylicin-1 n=1 Tax=Chrysochloris asiatica TaxID=185453 RepID=A0A9B0TZ40_CHRAS|nr:PREDICTED: cylicin-1 [Chrysochloris asiatica]